MTTENTSPLITIGVTCFNAMDTIERALQSAVQQNWKKREILVVDDGSVDNSVQVIRSFIEKCPEVRLIQHEINRGYSGALNTLLKEARGEFICFFDDDDESCIDRLSWQYARIVEYKKNGSSDIIFCFGNRQVVPIRGGKKAGNLKHSIGTFPPEPYGEDVCNYILCGIKKSGFSWGKVGTGTFMARRADILRLGGYDETLRRGEDSDLVIRAGLAGAYFIGVNQEIITQYVTDGVADEKSMDFNLLTTFTIFSKYRNFLSERKLLQFAITRQHSAFYFCSSWGKWKNGKYGSAFVFLLISWLLAPRYFASQFLENLKRRLRKYWKY